LVEEERAGDIESRFVQQFESRKMVA